MSMESARAFLERMRTDEEWRQKVLACADREERVALVTEAGFDFTPEEIQALKGELTDEELDLVVGGKGCDDLVGCILMCPKDFLQLMK